jgi:anthranilate phosphoribosyltransferase
VDGVSGNLLRYRVTPVELGLTEYPRETVLGGSAEENAATMRRILAGEQPGPLADMVALNAAAALYVTRRAPDLRAGVLMARETLLSGQALATLDSLVATSRSLAPATI